MPCRDGGAPVGGGGGGGRDVDVGDKVGLAKGIGGTRLSGESCDVASDAMNELRFVLIAAGVRGEVLMCC